jgi:hypothetical protein
MPIGGYVEEVGGGKAMSETTERVFRYVVEFKKVHDGISPTVREIAAGCGLGSATVARHLRVLQRARRIRAMGFGFSRGIIVPGGRWVITEER